jgi:hypothetical protein
VSLRYRQQVLQLVLRLVQRMIPLRLQRHLPKVLFLQQLVPVLDELLVLRLV